MHPSDDLGPIVSSGHLASGAMPALSEFEFALTMTVNAFHRWMLRGMTAAGVQELTAMDVLRATLPAGTLSGAPKIRAMELIHRVERDAAQSGHATSPFQASHCP